MRQAVINDLQQVASHGLSVVVLEVPLAIPRRVEGTLTSFNQLLLCLLDSPGGGQGGFHFLWLGVGGRVGDHHFLEGLKREE